MVGALTAVQSRLNGQLSTDIHNGIAAALISFGTGWIFVILACSFNRPDREGFKKYLARPAEPQIKTMGNPWWIGRWILRRYSKQRCTGYRSSYFHYLYRRRSDRIFNAG